VSLQLFGLLFSGLLFSSYTWKVLTALSADEADETPSKISYAWPRTPFGQSPLLVDVRSICGRSDRYCIAQSVRAGASREERSVDG
jgi:hypothetical protein